MTKFYFKIIVTSLVYATSCGQGKTEFNNWQGGAIKEPGIYYYKDNNLQLKVFIENKLLKYEMVDSSGKVLLRNGEITGSVLHNWAFYLDSEKNLWALSSDLGHVKWDYDPDQNKYSPVVLHHNIDRDIVPASLYRDLYEFFD